MELLDARPNRVRHPGTPFAEISRPDEAEIRMLAVDEDARGVGAASQLMDASEGYAREAGIAGVVLSTESSTLRIACMNVVAIRARPAAIGKRVDSAPRLLATAATCVVSDR